MPEITLERAERFRGRLLRIWEDRVRLPSGRESIREIVDYPGAVAILPLLDDGTVVLVRQYRHAIGRDLLEVPAGTLEPPEPPMACAARELREETGYEAARLEPLARCFTSPGWCTGELWIYRATGLSQVGAAPELDEEVQVEAVGPDDLPRLIQDGSIADAKTLIALAGSGLVTLPAG